MERNGSLAMASPTRPAYPQAAHGIKMDEAEARIARLEKEVRALRHRESRHWMIVVALLGTVLVAASGTPTPSVVRASTFELVDETGATRGTLGFAKRSEGVLAGAGVDAVCLVERAKRAGHLAGLAAALTERGIERDAGTVLLLAQLVPETAGLSPDELAILVRHDAATRAALLQELERVDAKGPGLPASRKTAVLALTDENCVQTTVPLE
jgi:hypothetical protein